MEYIPTDRSMMTDQSVIYRQRASALGKEAEAEADFEKMNTLLQTALAWIHLAENEELLSEATSI